MPEDQNFSDNSEMPTAVAAEKFLNQLKRKPLISPLEQGVDMEYARGLCRKITLDEEDILSIAQTFDEGDHYSNHEEGLTEDPLSIDVHKYGQFTDAIIEVAKSTAKIEGLGDLVDGQHQISLDYSESSRDIAIKELGMDTPFILRISVFNDAVTLNEINKMRNEGKISSEFMYTHYFFDRQGNFAKTFQLPLDFPDNRPVVHSNKYYKSVIGEMSSKDLELAEKAVGILKRDLTTFKEKENSK